MHHFSRSEGHFLQHGAWCMVSDKIQTWPAQDCPFDHHLVRLHPRNSGAFKPCIVPPRRYFDDISGSNTASLEMSTPCPHIFQRFQEWSDINPTLTNQRTSYRPHGTLAGILHTLPATRQTRPSVFRTNNDTTANSHNPVWLCSQTTHKAAMILSGCFRTFSPTSHNACPKTWNSMGTRTWFFLASWPPLPALLPQYASRNTFW